MLFFRYGLLGKKFKELLGHILGSILSGLVGLKKPRDHGVPYSLTEEFVSAYRMHSLLPETLVLRDITSSTSKDKHPPILHEYFPFSLFTLYLQILGGTSMMDIFLPFFSHLLWVFCILLKIYSFLWRPQHKCARSQEPCVQGQNQDYRIGDQIRENINLRS